MLEDERSFVEVPNGCRVCNLRRVRLAHCRMSDLEYSKFVTLSLRTERR